MRSHLTTNVIRKKYLTTAVQIGLIMGMSHAAYAVETTNNTENDEAATPSATLDTITVYSDVCCFSSISLLRVSMRPSIVLLNGFESVLLGLSLRHPDPTA